MSFGGSGNEGNSRNNTETSTTTNNNDNRLVVDNGSVGIGAGASGNTVNILDGGAIQDAFDFANQTNAIAGENYSNLLNTTTSALSGILNGIASTQNFIAETQNTAKGALDSRTITILAGTAAALIAFALWRKK